MRKGIRKGIYNSQYVGKRQNRNHVDNFRNNDTRQTEFLEMSHSQILVLRCGFDNSFRRLRGKWSVDPNRLLQFQAVSLHHFTQSRSGSILGQLVRWVLGTKYPKYFRYIPFFVAFRYHTKIDEEALFRGRVDRRE